MLNYKKINNIAGWAVFAIATIVYLLTVERTASFWDCGEFIAASYKLQVPHPPGAPLFLLIGRMFSFLAMGDVTKVAYWINVVSVLSSSFTILFMFWSITMLAKKVVAPKNNPDLSQLIGIIGSGVVGALAYTFSDSFWFSAVEAEVYAISSFFTAFVFWAILKWDLVADEHGSDKWLLLIAYVMGLSVGAHLLNLVTIPALAFVFYFRKFEYKFWTAVLTFIISIVLVLVILEGIIPGLPSLAGKFEIFFVNSLSLPVGGGIAFFAILFIGGLVWGINYSIKNNKRWLNTALLALSFILIGYISYGIILVRSQFNPPLDENNPENIISFVSYLKREQYGDRPLFKGPQYTANPIAQKEGAAIYRFNEKTRKYEIYDHKQKLEYAPTDETLIPRIWSKQPGHIQEYCRILDMQPNVKPTFGQNLEFMFKYQFGTQFFRYFGWNFVGRESDIQGAGVLTPIVKDSDYPKSILDNKARNNFYFLPLILGLLGLVWHFYQDKKGFTVVMSLFILTGLALSFYLNQPPIEPRERDYIFVGAYYAFAIWIGFGVLGLCEMLGNAIKNPKLLPIASTAIGLSVPAIMLAQGWDDHNRDNRYHSVDSAKNLLNSCAKNAILFTGGDNDTFPLWYVQEVEGFRTDVRVCNLSLLNTDWYIEQMKDVAYESKPLPITFPFEQILQGKNDYAVYRENPNVAGGIPLKDYLDLVKQSNPAIMESYPGGSYTTYPTDIFTLPIDSANVVKSGIVPAGLEKYILKELKWSVGKNTLEKKDLIILDMIANGNWERPIYFSTTLGPDNFLNLKPYMQLEGLAYRLLPVLAPNTSEDGRVQTNITFDNMTKNFFWRGLNDKTIYYDENYRRFPLNVRSSFQKLAEALLQEGKPEKAKQAINFCLDKITHDAIPYDYAVAQMVPIMLRVNDKARAEKVSDILVEKANDDLKYIVKTNPGDYELKSNLYIINLLSESFRQAGDEGRAKKYMSILQNYQNYMPQQ
ncbi:MAG: hypothetical protein RLZZ175_3096 [Bacteroidota bacterium]|jgi:MFS family permease